MEQETRARLEKELVRLTDDLSKMKSDSDEFRNQAEAINKIADKINESLKVELDYDQKVCSSEREDKIKRELGEAELAFKQRELDAKIADEKAKRRNNLIVEGTKAGVEICGIVIPLKFYAKFLEQGYLFEKQGIVTSATFKNLLRFIKPKK